MSHNLFPELDPGQTAAVSYIPEADTGDITALGNLWRDRIEKILVRRGIVVKARQDIITLIDDVETFGTTGDEQAVWDQAGADIVVCGRYTLLPVQDDRSTEKIQVVAKAFRAKDAVLLSTEEFVEPLGPAWHGLASKKLGNIHQEKFEHITSVTGGPGSAPELSVSLNRENNCFAPGEKAMLHIQARAGTYLYIFNLTADGNVTLLYPNKQMPDKPLAFDRFVFPRDNQNNGAGTELRLYPLKSGQTCRESFKIVASVQKLDFSFLPIPENQVFTGSNGKDIDRMTAVLKNAGEYSEARVIYSVGGRCEKGK